MAAAQVTSPRLPSPPPLTEDFIHPKSPITVSEDEGKLGEASKVDHGASRRIRPGTKAADMAEGPPLVDLSEIGSSFALTEHLKALHNAAIHPSPDTVQPIDRETALKLAQPPPDVDRAAWLHELCRFLCQKVNIILVALFADDPPCSANTCPEMRASEWQYLCAVHDPPKSCCAIDYCCHTLDWAATTLTSVKNFPNYGGERPLGADTTNQQGRVRQLTNVFRRVYRIFAHAWFQHREMFWKVEHSTGLYVFFKTVCDAYQLIPEDNYTIPPEAEGGVAEKGDEPPEHPVVLRRDTAEHVEPEKPEASLGSDIAAGNTTKRHRHSPSTGTNPVDTVIEEIDEDEDSKAETKAAQSAEQDATDGDVTQRNLLSTDTASEGGEPITSVLIDAEKPSISISKPETKGAPSGEDAENTPVAAKLEGAAATESNTSTGVIKAEDKGELDLSEVQEGESEAISTALKEETSTDLGVTGTKTEA